MQLHAREAIADATAACEAHAPEVFARFGAAGRAACMEDIGHHLDFARSALETGETAPFLTYLAWLDEVLASRGVPREGVPLSLRALGRFYTRHLPGEAGEAVAELMEAGAVAWSALALPLLPDPIDPEAWAEAEPYRHAALGGDRRGLQQAFDRALGRSASLLSPELHVIQPAMVEVGRAWQRNEVSVAQEHLATAMTLTLMAQAAASAEYPPETGRRVLLACAPGNHHALGLRIVGDAFELHGWQTQVLGANLPAAALAAQARAFEPQLIALSASLPQQLRELRSTVAMLKRQLGASCPPIGVGGQVFNRFPALARTVDALFLGRHAGEATAIAARALAPT